MNKLKSFTLIEVLIITSIFSIFFVNALFTTTFIVRNMKFQQRKLLATYYADELKEWLIFQKNNDWEYFKNKVGTYCFNDLTINEWPDVGECINFGLNNYFKRQVELNYEDAHKRIIGIITVSWIDIENNEKKVTINFLLSPWES